MEITANLGLLREELVWRYLAKGVESIAPSVLAQDPPANNALSLA